MRFCRLRCRSGLFHLGLRDVTRIAAGDSSLWTQILAANAGPVAEVVAAVAEDLATAARLLGGLPAVLFVILGLLLVFMAFMTRGQFSHTGRDQPIVPGA